MTRHVVETRTHLSRSNFNKCNIYKLHGLTFVGLEVAELDNHVTIVVNCNGVFYPAELCCKSNIIQCYCVDITLEFNHWNCFCEAWRVCILCTGIVLNSAVLYCEKYYITILLGFLIICEYLREDFFVQLMNWETWKRCFNICGNMHLKHSAQTFEQPILPFLVDCVIGEGKQDKFNKNRS
jgi:hypothetical protein